MQCVDESYDIPRSHQIPYMRCNNDGDAGEASSTLNRISMTSAKLDDGRFSNRTLSNSNLELHSATLPTRRPHCYTNAAPTKIEGNVFRYDFDEKVCFCLRYSPLLQQILTDNNIFIHTYFHNSLMHQRSIENLNRNHK